MKKINSSFVSIIMLLFFVLSVQSVFATDAPLKKDDPSNSNFPRFAARQVSVLPVSVDVESDLVTVYFNSSVGIAQVSITDEYGNVVYEDAIDTEFDSEMYIPTYDFDGGTYTIRITYSAETLIGEFTL